MGCRDGSRPWCWGSMGYVPAEGCSNNHSKTFTRHTQISASLSSGKRKFRVFDCTLWKFLFWPIFQICFLLFFDVNFCLERFSLLFYLLLLDINFKNAIHLYQFKKVTDYMRAIIAKHNKILLLLFFSLNYL